MTSAQWRRFCTDTQLISARLRTSQVDLIFVELTRSHLHGDTQLLKGTIGYAQFRQGLSKIAHAMYPE